jgi:glucosyl-3-phosphoglycerate phosphatase
LLPSLYSSPALGALFLAVVLCWNDFFFWQTLNPRHAAAAGSPHANDPEYWNQERVYDPLIFDSPLTARGEKQACEIQAKFPFLQPQLVVSSPLTRALQTARLAFSRTPLVVRPDLREQRHSSCDIGQSGLTLLNRFSELGPQLADLPDQWWGPGSHTELHALGYVPHTLREKDEEVCARLHEVLQFIQARPEQRIVLVGHGVLFFHLTGNWLENCELHPYYLASGISSCRCPQCFATRAPADQQLAERLEAAADAV